MMREESVELPFGVQMAGVLVWMYALCSLLSGAVAAVAFRGPLLLLGPVIHAGLAFVVGRALLGLRPWAWWVTMIFGAFNVFGRTMSLLFMNGVIQGRRVGRIDAASPALLVLGLAALVGALFFLLLGSSRHAFFTPRSGSFSPRR